MDRFRALQVNRIVSGLLVSFNRSWDSSRFGFHVVEIDDPTLRNDQLKGMMGLGRV